VIGSEQKMADAFVANKLLPTKFDVGDFFSDDFNSSVPAS
jgi:hypothetical protein